MSSFRPVNFPTLCGNGAMKPGFRPGRIPMSLAWGYVGFVYSTHLFTCNGGMLTIEPDPDRLCRVRMYRGRMFSDPVPIFYLRKTEDVQQSYAANPIDVVLLGGLRKPLKYLGIKFDRLETPQQEERRWPAAFDQVKLTTWDLNVSSC